MKDVSMNTGASWVATVKMPQNGDIAQESFWDQIFGSYADRLGYLKTLADGKASLSGVNVWTGLNTFQPSSGGQVVSAIFYRELRIVDAATSAVEAAKAGICSRRQVMNDANETWNPIADTFIVPQTTANRTYKFNGTGGNGGRRIRIWRPRTADAHTITLQDSASVTIAVIGASAQGWVEIEESLASAPSWLPVGFGGSVSSISTTVT